MDDVFRTALVESNGDKHKYGSYPDKTPLIMTEEQYILFFCHAGSVKTFDQCKCQMKICKPNCICFSKQNQFWTCSPAASHFVCKK